MRNYQRLFFFNWDENMSYRMKGEKCGAFSCANKWWGAIVTLSKLSLPLEHRRTKVFVKGFLRKRKSEKILLEVKGATENLSWQNLMFFGTDTDFKLHIRFSEKDTKKEKESPICFDVTEKMWDIFFQILWPSHNILTLICFRGRP